MADSEFDELDKAVASVLQPTAGDIVIPSEPAEKVIEVPTTAAPTVAPRARSTGRFMDVVPPASFAPAQPVQPTQLMPQPSAPPVEEPKTPNFDQPDPLDFHGFNLQETPKPAEVQPEVVPKPEEAPAEPLTTPFLSDAKVEKRPLGAFSDAPKPVEEETIETPVAAPAEKALDQKEEDALPAELHTDLLSVEASEPAPAPVVSGEEPPVPSIIQQYKEKPNSDTQPSAAIYDTDAYHMPLAHAPQKRNGWMVVIWIAALILVGGGIGAAVYFVILPMLG